MVSSDNLSPVVLGVGLGEGLGLAQGSLLLLPSETDENNDIAAMFGENLSGLNWSDVGGRVHVDGSRLTEGRMDPNDPEFASSSSTIDPSCSKSDTDEL